MSVVLREKKEIVVTDAMIEAGVTEFLSSDVESPIRNVPEIVRSILEASLKEAK